MKTCPPDVRLRAVAHAMRRFLQFAGEARKIRLSPVARALEQQWIC
jgi:hypothetical protein